MIESKPNIFHRALQHTTIFEEFPVLGKKCVALVVAVVVVAGSWSSLV